MKALFIVLFVLLALFLSLLLPITLSADLAAEPEVYIRWFFLRFKIEKKPPKKKKKKPSKKKPTEEKKKKEAPKKPQKKHKISYYIGLYGDLFKKLLSKAGDLLGHVVIKELNIDITVASEDAAACAVEYGAVCAVVYPCVSALESAAEVKKRTVCVNTDFDGQKPTASAFVKLSLKPLYVVSTAFAVLKIFIQYKLKDGA